MLDTVKLSIPDYNCSNADWDLTVGNINTRTGATKNSFPLYHDGEQWVEGMRCVAKNELFHLQLSAKCQGNAKRPTPYLSINFEVPKVAGGHNFHPATEKETRLAFSEAQKFINSVGIKCDLREAIPSRLDAFRNLLTEQPPSQYDCVFQACRATRMEDRTYENGWLYLNGQKQLSFYDKRMKMRRDKHSLVGIPKFVMRGEFRGTKKDSVQRIYGFENVNEMLKNQDHIATTYIDSMSNLLFRHTPDDVEIFLSNDIEADLRAFRDAGKRYWQREFLIAYALRGLLDKVSLKLMGEAIERVAGNRTAKSAFIREYEQAKWGIEFLKEAEKGKRTTGQLYEELRDKVTTPLKRGAKKFVKGSVYVANHSAAVAEATARIQRARRQQAAEVTQTEAENRATALQKRPKTKHICIGRNCPTCFPEYAGRAARNRTTGG
jgi:hypothetical protein